MPIHVLTNVHTYGVLYVCVWTHTKPAYVLFVFRTSVIVVNLCTNTITDRSQPAKNIDLYFKSRRELRPPKAGTDFTESAELTRRASAH